MNFNTIFTVLWYSVYSIAYPGNGTEISFCSKAILLNRTKLPNKQRAVYGAPKA